jgi:hypothetical protein
MDIVGMVTEEVHTQKNWQRESDELLKKIKEEDRLREKVFSAASAGKLLRKASVGDYADWLWQHLANGGKVDCVSDYNMPDDIYLARAFPLTPLYGSSAKTMIMPAEGKDMQPEDIGHNVIFFDDGTIHGIGSATLYADVAVVLKENGA